MGFKSGLRGHQRYIPLRYRFLLMTTATLILILSTLTVILSHLQSRTIQQQIEQRGLSIAQSLAAASMTDLLTYDALSLERSANQVAQHPDIVYVIIHDKEGRVAGYSGRSDLQHMRLQDETSRNVINSAATTIQRVGLDQNPTAEGLDVSVPVYLPDSNDRWGTVRVCLSLVPMQRQIRQMQWVIFCIGLIALALGMLIAVWTARRITRPLAVLVQGTRTVAKGDLDQQIAVRTGDEIEILADHFMVMVRHILMHRSELEARLTEIKRLQRYTEQLLTTMDDGLISIDITGSISAINPAARTILNRSEQQLPVGCRLADELEDFTELRRYIQQILTTSRHKPACELHRTGSDGDVQTVLVGSSMMKSMLGEPIEAIINLSDITPLKRLEAVVRQSERLAGLGTLAAGMAHEIRNPLSTIKTFVQLLPRKIDKPEFLAKFQRTVPRELDRINRLVQELLELSKAPKFRFEQTTLLPLLTQTVESLDVSSSSEPVTVECRAEENLPMIRADTAQLLKAFQNLAQNAVQAMPGGGRLSIDAYAENNAVRHREVESTADRWIAVVFSDTGIGIEPAIRNRIFEPFFTTKDVGTGLGLSITHKVITEHSGRIEIISRIDSGTQFIVRLPVYAT